MREILFGMSMAVAPFAGIWVAANETSAPTTLVGAIIAGFMAMGGAIVWFLRHMVMVTVPEMLKIHAESISKLAEAFRLEASEERRMAREVSNEHFDDRKHRHELLMTEIHRLAFTLRSIRDRGCARQQQDDPEPDPR